MIPTWLSTQTSAPIPPEVFLGASLLGYWDAERLDKISLSGSSVNSWTDVVANYAATQSTGSSKPTYSATSFNGRPGLTWDGVDDYMEFAPNPFPTTLVPMEIWALSDQPIPVTTSVRRLISIGATGGNCRTLGMSTDSVAPAISLQGSGGAVAANRTGFLGRHVSRVIIDTDGVTVAVDGTASAKTAGATTSDATRVRFGATSSTTPSNFAESTVSAFLFTQPLSAGQVAQLQAYLKTRGGIP